MYCKKCGKELINNEVNCPQRGTPVEESDGGGIVKNLIKEVSSTISQIAEVYLSNDDLSEKIKQIRQIIVPCPDNLPEDSVKNTNTVRMIISGELLLLPLCLLLLFTPHLYVSGWFNEESVNAFTQTVQGEPIIELMLLFILLYIENFLALILVGRLWNSNKYGKICSWFIPVSMPLFAIILLFRIMSAYNGSYYYDASLTVWGIMFVMINSAAVILRAYLYIIDFIITLNKNKQ